MTGYRPSRIGRRFLAKLLDLLILLPVFAWVGWIVFESRPMAMLIPLPSLAFNLWYNVYLVRLYGATPGKLLAKLRIAKLDGSPVEYREAILRYSVEFALGLLAQLALLVAIWRIPDAEYRRLDLASFASTIDLFKPAWSVFSQSLSFAWFLGVLIALFVHKHRRTLHDFVAGTIVVQR